MNMQAPPFSFQSYVRASSQQHADQWSSLLNSATNRTSVDTDSAADDSGGDDAWDDAPVRKRSKTRHGSLVRRRRGSVSSDSSSSEQTSNHGSNKPRKPTYLLQKEERDELVEEVRLLEARLELLKIKAGLPTVHDKNSVANIQCANFAVEEEIHGNLLRLGRFHSLLTRHLQTTPLNPLTTFVHLPRDPVERKSALEDLKPLKLRRAVDISMDRLHYLDHGKPYVHEERFLGRDGLYRLNYFEIKQFDLPGGARHLYETLLYFFSNIEISVSEMIGQLTVREDTDDSDPSIWNHRVVTTGDAGGAEELNTIGFGHFYDSFTPLNGSPLGVVALDTVDVDDLYPYRPLERTHKDVHASYTISEIRDADNRLVVVLKTCVFMAQHPPEFNAPPVVVEKLHENMTRWIHVMNKFLGEHTAAGAAPVS